MKKPGIQECEVVPLWEYSNLGVEIKVKLQTNLTKDVLPIAQVTGRGRGYFDFPHLRSKQHAAEALAYAWVVAAYLEEKGVRIKLRPTVDALAKLQSFIRLPDGQIVAN
ncbi:hypothetical protein [Alicyclobacillus acidocaldarius]|uniref:Uncharacterized protein n=1 Tax=Alicyclobacillus acidocaldarius (strain Tc-4-1) TaxID=1048834 RepID=F8IGK1_ALIAT|nr:hypothetical protein [Alicyclobacillus acidocaldarius]AEJ44281.1 hypothetical protein TC41_2381 [Alicyclobacillus acidocaldarius subsp. acidocaldarius Tc-4-1]